MDLRLKEPSRWKVRRIMVYTISSQKTLECVKVQVLSSDLNVVRTIHFLSER